MLNNVLTSFLVLYYINDEKGTFNDLNILCKN